MSFVWVVSELYQIGTFGKKQPVLFVEVLRNLKHRYEVVLDETTTGERKCVISGQSEVLLRMIQDYSPYGCVDWPNWAKGTIRHKLLIAVDKISLNFLGYVDRVEHVRYLADHQVSQILWRTHDDEANVRYSTIDADGSLISTRVVLYTISAQSSLFNTLCFAKVAWCGDCAHLFEGYNSEGALCLKVSFTDVTRARGLLAKAVTMKHNPINDYVQSRK